MGFRGKFTFVSLGLENMRLTFHRFSGLFLRVKQTAFSFVERIACKQEEELFRIIFDNALIYIYIFLYIIFLKFKENNMLFFYKNDSTAMNLSCFISIENYIYLVARRTKKNTSSRQIRIQRKKSFNGRLWEIKMKREQSW